MAFAGAAQAVVVAMVVVLEARAAEAAVEAQAVVGVGQPRWRG